MIRNTLCLSISMISLIAAKSSAAEPTALVRLSGKDFAGGAAAKYGSFQQGRTDVNFVYGKASGELSSMAAQFKTPAAQSPIFLYLTASDDDVPSKCDVRIELNGKPIHEGKTDA